MIIDGKTVAQKIINELKEKIAKLPTQPTLAVILVGENPASQIYVKTKHKKAMEVGMKSINIKLPENTTTAELLEKIEELNKNPEINAILVQLPLPKHIDEFKVIEKIAPIKDVDGFTMENIGRIFTGQKPYAYSCTPKGIVRLLDEYNIEIESKNTLIIGRSNIVGKPLAAMMCSRNASVLLAHSKTKNLSSIASRADIIIAAVGVPKLVKKEWVKPDAVVIDVGINRTPEGKLVGDVDFENIKDIASYITPVPGGVGPMTIAMLLENTLELYNLQNKKEQE